MEIHVHNVVQTYFYYKNQLLIMSLVGKYEKMSFSNYVVLKNNVSYSTL